MSSTVIRDFLVALNFKIDSTGEKKSKDALENMQKAAVVLNRALIALASAAVYGVAKTANELEKLYYSSQRIGASAENIKAYGDAVSQLGGNASEAIGSLENVARKLRESPGYEGMIKGLGVATRDQNGQMRDRVEVMKDLSKTLAGMEYYQANAYANSLGIDESTLMAMRDPKFIEGMDKYQALRTKMGYNTELAKSGQEFAYQWRDLTMQLKALSEVVLMTAGQALIPVLKVINAVLQAIIQWFGELDPQLQAFLKAGLKIAMLTVVFGGLFAAISKILKLVPLLKGLIFVIRALSLSFLMTPIGMVLAFAAAIALLFEDYMSWKNGSESLLDWDKWGAGIDKAITKIKELGKWLQDLTQQGMDLMFGEGSYERMIDWTSREVIEPAATLYNQAVEGATDLIEKGVGIFTGTGSKDEPVKPVVQQPNTGVTENTTSAKQVFQDSVNVISNAINNVGQFAKDVAGDANHKIEGNTGWSIGLNTKNFTVEKSKIIAEVASRIGVNPNDLAAVISFETAGTFSPSIKNPKSSATGLIQFMSGSGGTKGKYYGMSRGAFASLSFEEQMIYVEKYFKERGFRSDKPRDVADTYTAVTGYGYRDIPKYNARGVRIDAYHLNRVWDSNKDGYIAKGEMVQNDQFKAHQKQYFIQNDNKITTPTDKAALLRFSQNAEVPNNIKPVTPNVSNTQSSNRNVNINQKTDIHVMGGDATMTAKAVRTEQDIINMQLIRNSKGVFV